MNNKNEKILNDLKNRAKTIGNAVEKGVKTAGNAAVKGVEVISDSADIAKERIIEALDVNKNGQIDIEDIINLGMRVPTVWVDRESFLRKELKKHCTSEVIDKAVRTTPKKAGIPLDLVDKICDNVISHERFNVSGVSAALGIPGGLAMVGTIPVDIAQYYGVQLRAAQKIMYLYGFPEISRDTENGMIDSETISILTLCLGVMFGVKAANEGINLAAKMLARGVPKQLMKKALTKGAIYPIVKQVAKWFGLKMTKEVFTGAIGKSIPVVGAAVGGTITFVSFGPACKMLKKSLRQTALANPEKNFIGDEKNNNSISDNDCIVVDIDHSKSNS
ncbi:MAG: EcsC family protein [Oscillospiraceae bacterium]|nr:EcsC family protein [Oscillospiraceae bacterium]